MRPFFPTVWFGWVWLALLLSLVFTAAYVDFRRYVIPKWITISLLLAGVVLNGIRGGWLGWAGQAVWCLPSGWAWGILDGLLFALAGFATGFGLFFLLWLLRTCGGGDVKLFAALGAWIGPAWCLWVLGLSIVLVAILGTLKAVLGLITSGPRKGLPPLSGSRRRADKDLTVQEMLEQGQRPKRLLSFSLPVALSLALFLAWKLRHELLLPEILPGHQSASGSQVAMTAKGTKP
jgi:prepilin peptidase CpaA